MEKPIVILGSGMAGITLARELRKLDRDVPLAVVTADDGAFYPKPSISNALAQNKQPAQLAMNTSEQLSQLLGIKFYTHTQVSAIRRTDQVLATNQGDISYRQLVLAVGAQPFRLPLQGSAAAQVLSVNSLDDYTRFRAQLEGCRKVAILGAGLIGCEFANDLVSAGYAVEVFDIAAQPLGRLLPAQAAGFLRQRLEAAGVVFHLGTSISKADLALGQVAAGGVLLSTAEGVEFAADLVLSAIGLTPQRELAQAAGLAVSRGIVVDKYLQTSDVAIFALGDCADVEGLVLPFVMPIMHAARALAKTLAGERTAVVYPAMPVLVKTPACPTVVSPPAAGAVGAWREEVSEASVRALFEAADGQLLGCALLGEATKERQAMAAVLPPVLA